MSLIPWVAGLVLISAVQASGAVIAQNGRSDYKIVTPDRPGAAVKYAATELQDIFAQIGGVRLPIVRESTAGDCPAFLLGPCRKSAKAGLVEQAKQLAEDGVLIKTIGNDIALLGQNERGNLYSVYVLLEKYLDVRFLAWDCTIIPARHKVMLPDLDYSYAPPYMYREALYWDSFPKQIAARQRLNGPFTKCDETVGGKIKFHPYVHSFAELIPTSEYYEKHPEYFGLQGGKRVGGSVHAQLCLTNPDVLRISTEKVLRWIEENPDVPIIDVSQNDGNGPCECDECMSVVKEEGSQHGPIMRFVNAIADVVAEKHPHIWVETLAYAYSTKPPVTKPRDNVIIRLCHAGCYYHGFEKCGLGANFADYVNQWSERTRRIFIWHYATNFAHYLAPNPNLAGLAKDLKYYGSHGVNGVMVQCDYQSPGGELAELRQYLSAQLMWDPSQNPMTLRQDFCRGYYREAATDVLEYLKYLDDFATKPELHAFGAWEPKNTVPPELVTNALNILSRAYSAATDDEVRNRINKLMLPFWYMQLTYPDYYGVSDNDAVNIWRQTKQTIEANGITHVREGGANVDSWITEMDAQLLPLPKNVIFDLMRIGKARTENCFAWESRTVEIGGKSRRAVLQHPNPKGDSTATYQIELPADTKGKILMKFGTVITEKSTDGVRYSVFVDDKELFNKTITAFIAPKDDKSAQGSIMPVGEAYEEHTIDLTPYAGKTIALTLKTNAIEDNSYDWAHWVEPKIVRQGK